PGAVGPDARAGAGLLDFKGSPRRRLDQSHLSESARRRVPLGDPASRCRLDAEPGVGDAASDGPAERAAAETKKRQSSLGQMTHFNRGATMFRSMTAMVLAAGLASLAVRAADDKP